MGIFDDITPQADYIVKVCLGNSCRPNDGQAILRAVEKELGIYAGQSSSDGRFYLDVQLCFGHCENGPNMIINREIINEMTPEKVKTVFGPLKKR